jgi:renalase
MPVQNKTNNTSSVAIVGAGIAGLSCANALQAQGMTVRVFEKSRGVGGRMSTRRGPSWQCDHGAQYFTARSPEFQEELVRWRGAGVVECWSPRLCVIDAAHGPRRESTGPIKRYVGVPGMTGPARFLAESLDVQLETQVDGLIREPGGWRLSILGQGWQADLFDTVVLALPAPQALALLRQTTSPLKELVQAVRMRPAWALMLCLDESFDPGFDAAFVNAGPLRWIARNLSKPQRQGENMWLLHANPQWSDAHLEAEPGEVTSLLVEALQAIAPAAPLASTVHRWRYADTESSIGRDYLWDSEINLGLCGDWLNEAKVEGAWLSAIGLAKKLTRASKDNYFDAKLVSIDFASSLYASALSLRNDVLRFPLGRSLDKVDTQGEKEQLHFGITGNESELIACLCVRNISESHYKIRQMAVSAKFQGAGLGSRLMRYVEREMVRRGALEISLHARESAIIFYEKLGYNCVGESFDEVGIPHIKMQKIIR